MRGRLGGEDVTRGSVERAAEDERCERRRKAHGGQTEGGRQRRGEDGGVHLWVGEEGTGDDHACPKNRPPDRVRAQELPESTR